MVVYGRLFLFNLNLITSVYLYQLHFSCTSFLKLNKVFSTKIAKKKCKVSYFFESIILHRYAQSI